MAEQKTKTAETTEMSVEDKLKALYEMQKVDTATDKIKILRGELPLEVRDLEDEIAGLETRIGNHQNEVQKLEDSIVTKNNEIAQAQAQIKKYEEQQKNVRNNREFDSLSKEIEYQNLEIELSEKRKKEFSAQVGEKQKLIDDSRKVLEERKQDLSDKKSELDDIVKDTRKEETLLTEKSGKIRQRIDPRLLSAYTKIRNNARNGLAVVAVERDACGGCFNKIPPQRQLDIRSRKKIIVCEYCGRILVDPDIDRGKSEKKSPARKKK